MCEDNIAEQSVQGECCTPKRYTFRYLAPYGGSISGKRVQKLDCSDETTPVTAVADEAHEFYMWSDGVEDATRTDICATSDKIVTAVFKRKKFIVKYTVWNADFGYIPCDGKECESCTFEIAYGEDAPIVKAVPKQNFFNEKYTFLYWSDGLTSPKRQDINITEDCEFIACFGYKVEYSAGEGGRVKGMLTQTLLPGEDGEEVRAVANSGFVFAGWSNLSAADTTCVIPNREHGRCGLRNMRVKAYFQPIYKTFAYDLCYAAKCRVKHITLDIRHVDEAKFYVPKRDGYTFCGWYADRSYHTKIANETGRYLFGYSAFGLKSDTLYARWRRNDVKIARHKILMVFVDKIKAVLFSEKLRKCVRAEYKMTALDYELSRWCAKILYHLLNAWFAGRAVFEVDCYYTVKMVTGGFESGTTSACLKDHYLFADRIDEVAELASGYHNTITIIGGRDYEGVLFGSSGSATEGNACVIADDEWYIPLLCNCGPDEHMDKLKNGYIPIGRTIVETCLHELIHTIELDFDTGVSLHDAIKYAINRYGKSDMVNTLKPFLMGEFDMDGMMCGVPEEYWMR